MSQTTDPNEYVEQNRDQLRDVIQHSDDEFTRALAMVMLVKYGDEPDVERLREELDAAEQVVS